MHLDDAQLVSLCLQGETEAYGELIERYQTAVYATAFYYAGRYGAAEDIVQDAFLAAYRGLPRLRDPARFGPWLKEVTCRTAANWLRRHGKRLKSETPLPHRRTVSMEDYRQDPRGALELNERFEGIQRAIDTLPERYRLPVVLRYLQELSYGEIADFLGASPEEIRGILHRAGRHLRECLRDFRESEGDSQWQPVRK